jgi:hypothetical protein
LGKELTEKLIGKTLEECKKTVEKSKNDNDLINLMNSLLFAHRIILKGNALGDSFGTTVIANNAKLIDININEESAKLSKELEDLL